MFLCWGLWFLLFVEVGGWESRVWWVVFIIIIIWIYYCWVGYGKIYIFLDVYGFFLECVQMFSVFLIFVVDFRFYVMIWIVGVLQFQVFFDYLFCQKIWEFVMKLMCKMLVVCCMYGWSCCELFEIIQDYLIKVR